MFGKKKEEKTLTTTEALHMLKNLITCDVDECCMASMDKDDVIEKLDKIKKYNNNRGITYVKKSYHL